MIFRQMKRKKKHIGNGSAKLLNMLFYNRCQDVSEDEALRKFKDSHKKVMKALDSFSQEELFTKTFYPWVGGSCIGSYFISVTGSHYYWAMKKMKAYQKNCKQKKGDQL